MSQIKAKVTEVESFMGLNIVSFKHNELQLKMMSLELDQKIAKDANVILWVKPSSVAIGKNVSGMLSYSNQLQCKIKKIEEGQLLSIVTLKCDDITIQSLITKSSTTKMDLQIDQEVTAFIKASEVSIKELL